jgi:hypothetical protein
VSDQSNTFTSLELKVSIFVVNKPASRSFFYNIFHNASASVLTPHTDMTVVKTSLNSMPVAISNGSGELEETIDVKPRSKRGLATSNCPPTTFDKPQITKPPASANLNPTAEIMDGNSDISDFDLSSPATDMVATTDKDRPPPAATISVNQTTTEAGIHDSPLSSPGHTPSPPNAHGSKTSSPLSSPISTPSPPANAASLPTSKHPSPRTTTQIDLLAKQPSPRANEAPLPQAQPSIQPPRANPKASETSRKRRATRYEIECTHTDICTCPMHAAHPTTQPGNAGKGRYPHWSEWALGVKEWPESAVRSTLHRGAGEAW